MLTKVIPYTSKKFRVKNVTENLKGHFTKCWKLEKSNLNKSPLINNTDNTDSHLQLNINNSSLKYNLMPLLSPYTDTNITENNTNMINHHHKAILNKHIHQNMGTDESKSSVQRHSFILNCVSTFMYRAIEKRQKFMSDLKVREVNANTIIINF